MHSCSIEHSTLYNLQLNGAENIYLGQIQSETPYFQAGQTPSTLPFEPGGAYFSEDPFFNDCDEKDLNANLSLKMNDKEELKSQLDTCREAWALRIINSTQVYLYGGGFYSFFQRYMDTCAKTGNICQKRLVETSYSEEVWLYSIYTVGTEEVVTPRGGR
jgi:glucan 1,3-beta-glucosidase